jgi:hypothetical protein
LGRDGKEDEAVTVTDAEKLKCLEREIAMRKRIYTRFVDIGKMTRDKAEREIAIIEAIANDYREQKC